MTVGDLKEVIKELDNNVQIGILEEYDPETDVAVYNECQELAVLPEQQESDVLIFSTFNTGIQTQEKSEEE